MPTDDHTVYSLRHSFQDRIENANCSDRMQADLMGHEFGRPRYGDGPEMKRRQAFLEESNSLGRRPHDRKAIDLHSPRNLLRALE